MIVTRIEQITRNKSKVYLDEQLAFVLYKGELSRYKIKEEAELSQDQYNEIINTVLQKRSRLRCMNLLKSMDRTEYQLREKLKRDGYPQQVIEQAIDYVRGFGYINDKNYASRYIQCWHSRKSIRQIQQDLCNKGIAREDISEIISEYQPADETALIRKWVTKRGVDVKTAAPADLRRLYMFLLRKGFSSADISRVLHATYEFE